jgi:hypothetical protein
VEGNYLLPKDITPPEAPKEEVKVSQDVPVVKAIEPAVVLEENKQLPEIVHVPVSQRTYLEVVEAVESKSTTDEDSSSDTDTEDDDKEQEQTPDTIPETTPVVPPVQLDEGEKSGGEESKGSEEEEKEEEKGEEKKDQENEEKEINDGWNGYVRPEWSMLLPGCRRDWNLCLNPNAELFAYRAKKSEIFQTTDPGVYKINVTSTVGALFPIVWRQDVDRSKTYDYNFIGKIHAWNGSGVVEASSVCMTILLVRNFHPDNPDPLELEKFITPHTSILTDEESAIVPKRVEACALAIIDRIFDSTGLDMIRIHDLVRQRYKRFWDDYPHLDYHVSVILSSESYWSVVSSRCEHIAKNWKKRSLTYLQCLGSRRGYDEEEILIKYDYRRKYVKVRQCAQKALCAVVPVLGWAYFGYHQVTGGWLNRNGYRRKAIEGLTKELIPKQNLAIMVASKIRIQKFVGSERPIPPIWEKVDLPTLNIPTEEEKQSYLAKFGSHIDVPQTIPSNHPANLYEAVRHRMAFDRQVDEMKEDSFYHYATSILDKFCPIINVSYDNSCEHLISQYGVKKGTRLHLKKDEEWESKDAWSEGFVKAETYFKLEPKQRMIFNRTERFVGKLSKPMHDLCKGIKHWLNSTYKIMYVCGDTPDQMGAFVSLMENYSTHIENDVSSWDGSLTTTFLDVEKYFFSKFVEGFKDDDRDFLLEHWHHVWMTPKDRSFSFKSNHGRRSGDLWTSAFNTLLNVLLHMYVFDLDFNSDFKLMVLGDDSCLSYDGNLNANCITRSYSDLGMSCEVIFRERASQYQFCSGYFYNVDKGLRWGVKPFKTLAKFGVNYGNHRPDKFKGLLYGTAKSLLPICGHVPVVGAFMRAIVKTSKLRGIKAITDNRWENPYRPQGGLVLTPSLDTYLECAERYSVSADKLIEVDMFIESTVDIENCPYYLADDFFKQGCVSDLAVELDSNKWVTIEMAECDEKIEEMHKLKGVDNLVAAMRAGWEYGRSENELAASKGYVIDHRWCHSIFSAASYINLNFGVKLHKMYNAYAEKNGLINANKKKIKNKKKKTSQVAKRVAKRAVRMALRQGGAAVGSAVGLGPNHGYNAGAFLSKLIGTGDYKVSKNTILKGNVPDFSPSNHSVRVRHREFLGDIVGSTAFSTKTYSINPGDGVTFPWLSGMASLYTQYTIHGMVFTFSSTSADALNSTNTALGTVVMATQYNTYDTPFLTKIAMENHEFSNSSRPSDNFMHPIECKVSETPFRQHFVRTGALSASEDLRLYDWGKFTLATVGMQAAATIGELWVSYDVEFEKPRLNDGGYNNARHFRISNGPWDINNVFGIIERGIGGNMNAKIIGTKYDTFAFDPNITGGRYYFSIVLRGTGLSGFLLQTYTNCKLATEGWGFREASTTTYEIDTPTTSQSVTQLLVDVTGANATVKFDLPGFTTATSVDFLVLQVPGGSDFPLKLPEIYSSHLLQQSAPEIEEHETKEDDVLNLARTCDDKQFDELLNKMISLRNHRFQ